MTEFFPDVIVALATSEVALTVSTLDNDALDRHIQEMTPERAVEFALRVSAIAKVCSRAKAVALAKVVALRGTTFVDPADGTPYRLDQGRHRKIKDVPGFVEQLAADGIDARPLIPWFASDAFKVGDGIEGDARIKAAVQEWATWVDDTAVSLIELDPVTGKPKRR